MFKKFSFFLLSLIFTLVISFGLIPWKTVPFANAKKRKGNSFLNYEIETLDNFLITRPLSKFMSSGRYIIAMNFDKKNQLWVCSEDKGLTMYNKKNWMNYDSELKGSCKYFGKDIFGENSSTAVAASSGNAIWVGTIRHGLFVLFNNRWKKIGIPQGLSGIHIKALISDKRFKNAVLCATEEGLYSVVLDKKKDIKVKILPNPKLSDGTKIREFSTLAYDNKEEYIWAGAHIGGIGYFNYKKWRWFEPVHNDIEGQINSILVDKKDQVWAATKYGLLRFDRKNDIWKEMIDKYIIKIGIIDPYFTCLCEDNKGRLWIGTRRHGIFQFDPESGIWQHFTDKFWSSSYITGLSFDHQGRLWVGSYNCGILCIEPKELKQLKDIPFLNGNNKANKTSLAVIKSRPAKKVKISTSQKLKTGNKKREQFGILQKKIKNYLIDQEYEDALDEVKDAIENPDFKSFKYDLGVEKRKIELISEFWQIMKGAKQKLVGQKLKGLHGTVKDISGTVMTIVSDKGERIIDLKKSEWKTIEDASKKVSPENQNKFLLGFALFRFSELWDVEKYNEIVSSLLYLLRNKIKNKQKVMYIGPDWQTQGNWISRYGGSAWVLCAAFPPFDYKGGKLLKLKQFQYKGYIGINSPQPGDKVRYLCWKENDPDEPAVLQDPVSGGRRPSGWDDHAENYPYYHDSPHLYVDIDIPKGNYILSFYFLNYDGWQRNSRYRDYTFLLKNRAENIRDFEAVDAITRTRVNYFYDGVYQRFAVKGPVKLTVKIQKDMGFNEMLSGIFLDPADAPVLIEEDKKIAAFDMMFIYEYRKKIMDPSFPQNMFLKKEIPALDNIPALTMFYSHYYLEQCILILKLLKFYNIRNLTGYTDFIRSEKLSIINMLFDLLKSFPLSEATIEAQRLLTEFYHVSYMYENRDKEFDKYISMWKQYVKMKSSDNKKQLLRFESACKFIGKIPWIKGNLDPPGGKTRILYKEFFQSLVDCLSFEKVRERLAEYGKILMKRDLCAAEAAYNVIFDNSKEEDISKALSVEERNNYALCFMSQGKNLEAIAVLESLLEDCKECKDRPEYLMFLAIALRQATKQEKWRPYYNMLKEEYPDSKEYKRIKDLDKKADEFKNKLDSESF